MPIAVPPDDLHNRTLVDNLHPAGWVNPAPAERYQLVVIGGGPAGLVSAVGARGLGARVALIERHLLGGDCLNVGCVPSKALLRCARAAAETRRAADYGVRVPGPIDVDFPAVMERMRRLRAEFSPHDSAERLQSLGIDVFLGKARFSGPDRVDVNGTPLRFSKAIVATGTRAAMPSIPGLDAARVLTNETLFTLTELPRRLTVIGGGPIGCEMSQAFARFGSEVHLIESGDRILPRDDPDAAAVVAAALARDGVEVHLATRVSQVTGSTPATLHLQAGDSRSQTILADAILVAAGRVPNVELLGLENAEVRWDSKGITVDDRLRTSNPRVYAAGDVASRFKFTHAADALARVAIQNALTPLGAKASSVTVPWCTYTEPELAHVGLTEAEARDRGIRLSTFTHCFDAVDRARLDGETEGFVRLHVRQGTDRLVGATIVGAHAGEMISELTLAIAGRVGLKTLASTIHPYPSRAEAIRKAAEAWNRTRLTPFVRRILSLWLRWMS